MEIFRTGQFITSSGRERLIHIGLWTAYYFISLTGNMNIQEIGLTDIVWSMPVLLFQAGLFYFSLRRIMPTLYSQDRRFLFSSLLTALAFVCLYSFYVVFISKAYYEFGFGSGVEVVRSGCLKVFVIYLAALAVFYHLQRVEEIRQDTRKKLNDTEQQAVLANQQLLQLKNQFNSHLTFNTLNLLYAKVLDQPSLYQPILLLSSYLRYNLKTSPSEQVLLSHELEHINKYIELYNLIHQDVCIHFTLEGQDPESIMLSPRILINYVENALKHGMIRDRENPVEIAVFAGEQVYFRVRNRKSNQPRQGTGLGNENTLRTLDLFYGSDYTLNIKEDDTFYEVNLSLPAHYKPAQKSRKLSRLVKRVK